MAIVHINDINPELQHFLFDSRKIVLKNPFNGFCSRCYIKYLDCVYQYFTMVPNSGFGNRPIDFLTQSKGNDFKANMLIGSYTTALPTQEYNRLYSEFEQLSGTIGHLDNFTDKIKKIKRYYDLKLLSDETIEKMLLLQDKFDSNLTDNTISQFDYMYYQYYQSVENTRKQRLSCILLSEGKSYTKQL